jgi:hypothetical protein
MQVRQPIPVFSNPFDVHFHNGSIYDPKAIWCITYLWAPASSITDEIWNFLENKIANEETWRIDVRLMQCVHKLHIWMCGRWTLPHNLFVRHRKKWIIALAFLHQSSDHVTECINRSEILNIQWVSWEWLDLEATDDLFFGLSLVTFVELGTLSRHSGVNHPSQNQLNLPLVFLCLSSEGNLRRAKDTKPAFFVSCANGNLFKTRQISYTSSCASQKCSGVMKVNQR